MDLDEAEEKLGKILKTHFAQFGGYSNKQLLFGAASKDLSMFLNDNDCENIDAVFAIARFYLRKRRQPEDRISFIHRISLKRSRTFP